MNLPYNTEHDAVEFWRPVADILECGPVLRCDLDKFLQEATEVMLARCVLWLAERGCWVAPLSCGGFVARRWSDFGVIDSRSHAVAESMCIFTAYKQAVLAVAGEGE